MKHEIVILGAGLTGLSLGYFLNKNTIILEKDNEIGGLCRTFKKGNFSYDVGAHIIFSNDKEILKFMIDILDSNIQKLYRNSKIFFKGKYLQYPFENDLSALDKEDTFYCLYHYLENNYPSPKNFKEWIFSTFGKGLAEYYLEPYNKKIWKYPLEKMSFKWVKRVPKPPASDVIKSALGIKTEGKKHQSYFYYPNKKGIQAIPEAIKEKSKEKSELKTKFTIKSIKKVNNLWEISNGIDTYKTKTLISTIPIHELANLVKGVPEEIKKAIKNLIFNKMYVVLIGLNNPNLKDKTSLQIPDSKIIFHRIAYNKYFGENYVPASKSAITVEITFPPGHTLDSEPQEKIVKRVIDDLAKLKIIKKEEVCETDIQKIDYSYVVYDIEHEKTIKYIKDYFNTMGIHLCGRFAEFQYLNMDGCLRHSLDLANELNKK